MPDFLTVPVAERPRRVRTVAWIVGAALLLMGLGVSVTAVGQGASGRTVRALEFVLQDRTGTTRAKFRQAADELIALDLLDNRGRVRMTVGLDEEGRPGLVWRDLQGARIVLALVGPGERPRLDLHDERGEMRASFGFVGRGWPGLILRDGQGMARTAVVLSGQNQGAKLDLLDLHGASRLEAGIEDQGGSEIKFLDKNQRTRGRLGLTGNGSPALTFLDERRSPRLILLVAPDETPHLHLFDRSGLSLWSASPK